MKKVVYNDCYGGFGLSDLAMDKLYEWGHPLVELNPNYDPKKRLNNYSNPRYKYVSESKWTRHDPLLVRVVEELGERANGECADLQIQEVSGLYVVQEYDGKEWIETPESIEWEYTDDQ